MVQVSYPGVYVEEVPSGVRPIAAASTSVAAFIGTAEKGPIDEAVKVYNFTEYQNQYGGFLDSSYLSHAVYQFFNNGGTQCYIIRVSGENTATANIVLNDRGSAAQASLTIAAISPGVWGNTLAVVIADGTNNPGNEFNLVVYWEDETTPLESYENLSMIPSASNFVETVISSSKYIEVSTNQSNTNVESGTSQGAAAPLPLDDTGRTRFRINIDGDGYQEVDLQDAVTSGTVTDLSTAANISAAIADVVQQLTRNRESTNQNSFNNFTCQVDVSTGALVLTCGVASLSSSVNVAPASNSSQNAAGLLSLGSLEGGTEAVGSAVTRPLNNPAGEPPSNFLFLGDDASNTVQEGYDGDPITNEQPYIDAFSILDDIEDVSLIAVPGIGSEAVMGSAMNYCENRPLSDCFFIGDMAQDDDDVEEAKTFWGGQSRRRIPTALFTCRGCRYWILRGNPQNQFWCRHQDL